MIDVEFFDYLCDYWNLETESDSRSLYARNLIQSFVSVGSVGWTRCIQRYTRVNRRRVTVCVCIWYTSALPRDRAGFYSSNTWEFIREVSGSESLSRIPEYSEVFISYSSRLLE